MKNALEIDNIILKKEQKQSLKLIATSNNIYLYTE